eukprot:TRINITY_DN6072_c3_g1_i5.p1 TRINITY_DN6072_c3_g1~~TRINITY_DN6072_c3_g1_i5.p1  ORF type:complete len:728 (+),score=179.21 TRINITY_DN6072_c3_g1_i5:112-2295(+)
MAQKRRTSSFVRRQLDEAQQAAALLDAEPGDAGLMTEDDAAAHRRALLELNDALLQEGRQFVGSAKERERRRAEAEARLAGLAARPQGLSDSQSAAVNGGGRTSGELVALDHYLVGEYKHTQKGGPQPEMPQVQSAVQPLPALRNSPRRGECAHSGPASARSTNYALEQEALLAAARSQPSISLQRQEATTRGRIEATHLAGTEEALSCEQHGRQAAASAAVANCITAEVAARRAVVHSEAAVRDALGERHPTRLAADPSSGAPAPAPASAAPAPAPAPGPPPDQQQQQQQPQPDPPGSRQVTTVSAATAPVGSGGQTLQTPRSGAAQSAPSDDEEFAEWLQTATEQQLQTEADRQAREIVELERYADNQMEAVADWTPAKAMDAIAKLYDQIATEETMYQALRELLRGARLLPAEHHSPRTGRRASQGLVASARAGSPPQHAGGEAEAPAAGGPMASPRPMYCADSAPAHPAAGSRAPTWSTSSPPPSTRTGGSGAPPPQSSSSSDDLVPPDPPPEAAEGGAAAAEAGPATPPPAGPPQGTPSVPPLRMGARDPSLSTEMLAKLRDEDAAMQEQLRQERAARRNKCLARAASLDDLGKLQSLLPSLNLAAGGKHGMQPISSSPQGSPDAELAEQLRMEQIGRANKQFAKSMSLDCLGAGGGLAHMLQGVGVPVQTQKAGVKPLKHDPAPAPAAAPAPAQDPSGEAAGDGSASPRGARPAGLYGPGS